MMRVTSDKLTQSLGSKRTGDCQELWRSRRINEYRDMFDFCGNINLMKRSLYILECGLVSIGISLHTRRFALARVLMGEMSEWDCMLSKGNCESNLSVDLMV